MKAKYLILLDADKIHDYVFSTNKLKEIRGASALIDDLVLEDIPAIVERHNPNYNLIFSAGGTSLISATEDSEDKIIEFVQEIEDKFNAKTATATITTAWAVWGDGKSFPEARDDVYKKLKIKKLSKENAIDVVTNPFFKFCMACGCHSAEDHHLQKKEVFICGACLKKINAGLTVQKQKQGNSNERKDIYTYFKEKNVNAKFPDELSEIGGASTPSNYIGFLYADGNQMGEKLKKINSEAEYNKFSLLLDKATKEAAVEAVCFYLRSSSLKYPVEFILSGGDDLIMIVPGNVALPIAAKFCDLFQEKTNTANYPTRLTTSVGVVISHSNYPIKSLLRLSESLLKGAKNKGWEENKTSTLSMINFLIIKGSMTEPDAWIKDYTYTSIERNEMRLTLRPYQASELQKLMRAIQNLKRSDLPHTRVKSLREILLKDKAQSVLEFCHLLSRLKGKEKALDEIFSIVKEFDLDFMPWKKDGSKFYTPFLDIVELYDFISAEVSI